jgi:hypothetical protein
MRAIRVVESGACNALILMMIRDAGMGRVSGRRACEDSPELLSGVNNKCRYQNFRRPGEGRGLATFMASTSRWVIRFAHPYGAILRMFSARCASSGLRRDDGMKHSRFC